MTSRTEISHFSWDDLNRDHIKWLENSTEGKQLIVENKTFPFTIFTRTRNFKNAIFKNCLFPRGCNVNLSDCDLTDCDFTDTKSFLKHDTDRRISFENSNLTNVNFSNCDLIGCDFTNAILENVNIANAQIDDNFRNALAAYEIKKQQIEAERKVKEEEQRIAEQKAKEEQQRIAEQEKNKQSIPKLDAPLPITDAPGYQEWNKSNEDHVLWLSDSSKGKQLVVENVNFRIWGGFKWTRNFKNAIFKNCLFPRNCNVNLNDCELINCDFTETESFLTEGSTKSHISFENSKLTGCNFSNVNLIGCNFTNTVLENVNITNTKIDDHFRNALAEFERKKEKQKHELNKQTETKPEQTELEHYPRPVAASTNIETSPIPFTILPLVPSSLPSITSIEEFEKQYLEHQLYLSDSTKGKCLDIKNIDLSLFFDFFQNKNFSHAKFNNVKFPYVIQDCNFQYASLKNSNLQNCKIKGNFSSATLQNINLERANIYYCTFTNTIFENVSYDHYTEYGQPNVTNLFSKKQSLQFLSREEFNKKYEDHILWLNDNSKGKRLDLSNYDLSNRSFTEFRNFSHAICENTSFPTICNINFENAKLTKADFRGLAGNNRINFLNADLTGADFKYATLDDHNFNGAILDDVFVDDNSRNINILAKIKKLKEQKIQELQNQKMKEITEEITEEKTQLENLRKTNESLINTNKLLLTTNELLVGKNDSLSIQNRNLLSEQNKLTNAIKTRDEAITSRDEYRKQLDQQISKAEDLKNQLDNEKIKIRDNYVSISDYNALVQSSLSEIDKLKNRLKSLPPSSDLQTLKTDNEILNKLLEEYKSKIIDLEDKITFFKNGFDNISAENNISETQIEKLQVIISDLKIENDQLKEEVKNLQEDKKDLYERVDNLKSENDILEDEKCDLEEQNKELEEKIETLDEEKSDLENENTELEEKIEGLEHDASQLNEDKDNFEGEIEELKEQISSFEIQIIDIKTEKENTERENQILEEKVKELNEYIYELENKHKRLDERIDFLNSELAKVFVASELTTSPPACAKPIPLTKQLQKTKEDTVSIIKSAAKIGIGNQCAVIIHNNTKKLLINTGIPKEILNNPLVDSFINILGPQILLQLSKSIPQLKVSPKLQVILDHACVGSISKVSSDTIETVAKSILPSLIPMFNELEGEKPKKRLSSKIKNSTRAS